MANFANDFIDLIALKLKPLGQYDYPLPVSLGALLLLGAVYGVGYSSALGFPWQASVALGFALVASFTGAQTWILGRMYKKASAPSAPGFGFFAVTNSLAMLQGFGFAHPVLAALSALWSVYVLFVQVRGLFLGAKGTVPALRIALGYFLAFIVAVICADAFLYLLSVFGAIDLSEAMIKAKEYMEQPAP